MGSGGGFAAGNRVRDLVLEQTGGPELRVAVRGVHLD